MLDICEKYASDHGITISINRIAKKSKTKCLAFNVRSEPTCLKLYDLDVPWVKSAKHLGHTIHVDENSSHDLLIRRGEFIGKVHSFRQELGSQDPHVFLKLVQIYLGSMYGSNLWDLFSRHAEKLYTSWNILIRTTFNIHYATHRYIVYNLTEIPHIRLSLLKRFSNFYKKRGNSVKPEVRHLFNIQKLDCRSTFGRNCFNLLNEYKLFDLHALDPKQLSMKIALLDTDKWKIDFIRELIMLRDGSLDSNFSLGEIKNTLDYLCTA